MDSWVYLDREWREFMAEKLEQKMKEITERLDQGVKELFTSEKYKEYLKTMSQFHNYSFNNTLLIAMQKPEATLVAGFSAWNKKFNRQVKHGEKGIKIIAPVPIRIKEETEKFDPETNEPVLRSDGQPETEEVEHVIPRFRMVTVFDISQTYGEPLPELDTPELMGSVENFEIFMKAIEMMSPASMHYAQIEGDAKGYYSNNNKEIVLQEGMSEKQTMKTAVHEVTHAMCHDRNVMERLGEEKNQTTKEIEAESVAYTVCSYFHLDTSDYSFPYIAGWSSDMDRKELRNSMEFIRKTAGSLIEGMVENIQKLQRETLDKEYLEENDLILKVVFSLTDDMFTYFAVANKDRQELLAQLKNYHALYGRSNEMAVETFLEGQGIIPIPWYDSEGLMVENPVDFFDFEYIYEVGIVDALELPAMKQAELLINRTEYRKDIFSMQDKNLILDYTYTFDNIEDTKVLIQQLAEAIESHGMWTAQEIRDNAQEEIDNLPDNMVGLSEMHEFGYHSHSVLPLTMERAVELHHAGLHIYSLQKDESSVLMNTELEILEAGGMFGVDTESWEYYQIMQSVHEENQEQENQLEDVPERDILLGLDTDGNMEEYEEVEIFQVPALFSNGRIAENEVPEGLYRYDLRGSDYDTGKPITVENHVAVNHAGTILSIHPFPIPEKGYLSLGEELNFIGRMAKVEQFLQSAMTLNSAVMEERLQDAVICSNEELLYTDTADRYAIFQINEDGKGREYLFANIDYIKNHRMEIRGEDYALVYGGRLKPEDNLDKIYERFNLNHPEGYTGHSLSVSDVVVVNRGGKATAHFIDSFGFPQLPNFIKQREHVLEEEAKWQIPEEEMYPPLYIHTLSYAMEHGMADDYLVSRKWNLDCKNAIEDAIRNNFDGMHLAHDAAEEILEEYGAERVIFILANTVQHLEQDGRFSRENKAWANKYEIPKNINSGKDLNIDYIVNSHPAVLDGFIGLAREGIREQALDKETNMQISKETKGFFVDGHFGTWHTAEVRKISDELFYRMEHEEYGDSVASIIVNQEGELVAEDLEHGFDQGAIEAIAEYLSEREFAIEPEVPFPAQYYVIQAVSNETSIEEALCFQDINAAFHAYHQIPNHRNKQIGIDITQQPPFRIPLLTCKNGIETLSDIDFNHIEEISNVVMGKEQSELRTFPETLSRKWVREETKEALQKAKEYLESYDMEIAYQTEKGYFLIHTVSNGYYYAVYGQDFREIEDGIYGNLNIAIGEAMEIILSDKGIPMTTCKVMNDKELRENVEIVAHQDFQKAEKEKKMLFISNITEPEPAFNGQSRAKIEETTLCYAQAQIDKMGLTKEVELLGARVYGSRTREGLYQEGSDIDVVISYHGDLKEDVFFNMLHEEKFKIEGILVDINPISTEKTGTLEEYLKNAEKYLDEKQNYMEIPEKSEQTEKKSTITFYVAECMEFPVLGEYHERLETLQEAMELYEKIPVERMNGGKGIGFCLENSSTNDGNFDLMVMGEIQTEFINKIPPYRDSPLVQKAIAEMEAILLERTAQKEKSEPEKLPEMPRQLKSLKNEEKMIQADKTRKSEVATQETKQNTARIETKAAKPEKSVENVPKTNRNISGNSRKQSILNALRERQARKKAQEQEKQGQQSQTRKKGEQQL